MSYRLVSTHDHFALVPVTGYWRWQDFFKEQGIGLQDVLRHEHERASGRERLPRTFVLLADREPVGMVTLTENDLELRPNLNPWLADLYVAESYRGRGHGLRLVQGLEARAREAGIGNLWLFTIGAARLYAKAGWTVVETVTRQGRALTIMSREL